jgi:SAM-dependent methyltransferase
MSTDCWQQENQKILQFYTRLVRKHALAPQSLDWGSRQSQELRFRVLSEIAPLAGTDVLDVGCGLADFLAYLRQRGLDTTYTGYDLTPELIALARRRFPEATLEVCDLLTGPQLPATFDYVVASGIFYLHRVDPIGYLHTLVERMFALCRRGLAFNTLSTRAPQPDPEEFHADPATVLDFCLQLTPRVTVRHDYLPHDFTVYLYKGSA